MPYADLSKGREIILTFDDGPHLVQTPKLLDILAAHGVRATFFVLGEHIADPKGRAIMERAHKEGHLIGNHTYSHPNLTKLPEDAIRQELTRTQDLIGACAHPKKLMRPPYGAHNALVDSILVAEGYTTIYWNVDSLDWKVKDQWVDQAFGQVEDREHSIVLAHDIHATTVAHVDEFLQRVKGLAQIQFSMVA